MNGESRNVVLVVVERICERVHGLHWSSHSHVGGIVHTSSHRIVLARICAHEVHRRCLQLSTKSCSVVIVHVHRLSILGIELLLLSSSLLQLVFPVARQGIGITQITYAGGLKADRLIRMITARSALLLSL